MFFVEKDLKLDIIIPRIFFEQIIPLSSPEMIKVYMYCYFLSFEELDENINIEMLADRLNMSVDEINVAWEFCEACGIVKRHRVDGSNEYWIEFLDLTKISSTKKRKKELSIQELLLISQNQEHKKMLDQIEESIGTYLVPEEIRKIENFINEYNIHKALIVEAFRFCVEKKKSRTVKMALGVARTWYLEGIRSVEDLDIYNQRKGNRYSEYKKVLSFLGEYRTATKAEEELIDKWIDEFKFSLEVIEEACKRSVGIKSPNLKYIDGILKNWDTETEKLNIKDNNIEKKDPTIFRLKILEALNHKEKSLSIKELNLMKFLYESFSLEDVLLGIDGLEKFGREKNIENLYSLLNEPCGKEIKPVTKIPDINENRIGLMEIKGIIDKKIDPKEKKDKLSEGKKAKNDDTEKLLLEKRKKWREELLNGKGN
ncbi:MAG: DnaD domain protein [Filifactoraceae bacterium]